MDIRETVIEFRGNQYPCLEYNGMHYELGTLPDVIKAIDTARRCHTRVRLFLGDTATGKAWQEEHDVTGYIGRSTGPKCVPLLINNARSLGGGAITTTSIVAIMAQAGNFLYKHPSFDPGKWDVRENQLNQERPFAAYCNDNLHARFKSEKSARNYCEFMTGHRMCK